MDSKTQPTHAGGGRDARTVLEEHGLRYSRARAAIVAFLLERDRHVSAEGLHRALNERGEPVSLSTVYLNLGVLAECGVVRELTGAGGETLFDSNADPHAHLVCTETGDVLDVDLPTVEGEPLLRYVQRTLEQATGWRVDEPRLQLRGRSPGAAADD